MQKNVIHARNNFEVDGKKKWNAEKASFCLQKIIEQACDQSNRRYYIYFFI